MQTELERRRERRQIVTGNWPHFPVLPVKRHTPRSYRPEIGVIFWDREIETKPVKVYRTNLLVLSERTRDFVQAHNRKPRFSELLEDVKTVDYKSLDEMLNDGWIGD